MEYLIVILMAAILVIFIYLLSHKALQEEAPSDEVAKMVSSEIHELTRRSTQILLEKEKKKKIINGDHE